MAEMIYTHIEPSEDYVNKTYSKTYLKNRRTNSEYKKLRVNINNHGILYPIIASCNNQVIGKLDIGGQRMGIAIDLCLNKIPAILYSIYRKTGFKGTPITGIDDIVKICGESIKSEPVYQIVVGAIKNIRWRNNYPPDPLKSK
jgi:hypothetical protein